MEQFFSYIIGLGAAVMMPILFTVLGLFMGIRFGKAMKSSDFTKDINEYWSQLTEPAARTVTVSIYIDRVRVFPRNIGAYSDLGMIDCYYRPGVSVLGFCIDKYAAAVSAWSSPFMTATYRAGSTKPEYSLLYNPFQSLPSNVDDCELYWNGVSNKARCQYDTSSVDLSIADISPRYDSTNIYYDNLWADAGWNDSPAAVYSWLTNGSPNASELNRLTIYNDVGEFVK